MNASASTSTASLRNGEQAWDVRDHMGRQLAAGVFAPSPDLEAATVDFRHVLVASGWSPFGIYLRRHGITVVNVEPIRSEVSRG